MLEFIKKYKLAYTVYNVFHKAKLKHNIPLYKKYGIRKKYYSSISSKDFLNVESPLNVYDEKNSMDYMENDPHFNKLPDRIKPHLLSWSDNGYVIIPSFFSEKRVNEINDSINTLIESNKANWRYRNKIMFSHKISEVINSAGNDTLLHNVLKTLLGKPVKLFQSINFITGSNQKTHSDSIHMTTFPYGNLIAVWVALEDIKADSGPLHYYSGSHKLPYLMNKDFDNEGTRIKLGKYSYDTYEDKIEEIVKENRYNKEIFLAKKGDILVWHANLLHGGEAVSNPESTRKSMVFHYYSTDAICYHEVTQRPSLME